VKGENPPGDFHLFFTVPKTFFYLAKKFLQVPKEMKKISLY
jgi:hypothetical protein